MIKWKYRPTGNAPVQAEGYFRKHQFYFRSRGTQATIEFFKTEEDWETGNIAAEYLLLTMDYPEASWLPKWMCYILIYIGCIRFLFKKLKKTIMKKVVLVLGLILAALCGFSQEPIKVVTYKNCAGTWNETKKEYDYQPYNYSKITFTFSGDYIVGDDIAHSVYRVITRLPDQNKDGCKITLARCTDEKNVECMFAIKTPADCRPTTIGILYNGYMFIYVMDQE